MPNIEKNYKQISTTEGKLNTVNDKGLSLLVPRSGFDFRLFWDLLEYILICEAYKSNYSEKNSRHISLIIQIK